jgi:hypothetical protein
VSQTNQTRSEEIGKPKARRNFSWSTTKTANGYGWKVYEIIGRATPNAEGHYAEYADVKTGTRPTRAQASGEAKRWTKYLRAGGAL